MDAAVSLYVLAVYWLYATQCTFSCCSFDVLVSTSRSAAADSRADSRPQQVLQLADATDSSAAMLPNRATEHAPLLLERASVLPRGKVPLEKSILQLRALRAVRLPIPYTCGTLSSTQTTTPQRTFPSSCQRYTGRSTCSRSSGIWKCTHQVAAKNRTEYAKPEGGTELRLGGFNILQRLPWCAGSSPRIALYFCRERAIARRYATRTYISKYSRTRGNP